MRLALLALAAALAGSAHAADPPAKTKNAAASTGRAPVSASLLGPGWGMVNKNGSVSLDDVTMPTHALAALEDAKVIGDPLYRFGETDYRWVALDTWNFTRSFDAPPELLAHTAVDLVATGVDTVATVVVNGKVVAGLDNAHRRHRIALKDVLTPGRNDITFVFASAITEAIARNASSPYWIPALTEAQAAPFNMVRKPASDFGWDWGPAFAPAGLYGDVQLVGYSDAHLVGCNVRQQHDTEGAPPAADGKAGAAKVTLTFDAVLQALAPGEAGTLAISPSSPNASPAWTATGSVKAARAGANIVSLAIDLPAGSYEKWWPVGYGGQPLYTFDVVYTPATAPDAATALSRRIGVRTVDLVRDPIPVADVGGDGGETFFFRVNGVPVYAKGTNMIPIHIVASRTTASDLVGMVKASVAANMNMVRVWGGGLYPADAFYDACDEAGVLVWQEFMAACALYPRDPAFAEEVRKEVTYQARRLNHHASMAIWGGNNEIEASFGWFTPSRTNERLYVADYTALFVDVVRSAVRAVDAGVAFVDTSPSKGVIVNGAGDDYVKRWGDVADWRRGDVHFYTVTDDALNLTTFPRAKFVSEFGFQSFASWEAVKGDLAGPGDWSHNATAIEFRQRHPGNTASLNTQMARHYQVPAAWAPPGLGKAGAAAAQEGLFKAWIYLTQVYQAAAYETASGYWRRIKDEADAQTMGVLYWQLNDIWPGYSWSSLDYGGGWKLLHYSVKRFFAPFLASGGVRDGVVDAYATSDINAPVAGSLRLDVIAHDAGVGSKPVHTITAPFDLAPLASARLVAKNVSDLLKEAGGWSAGDVFVRISAVAAEKPAAAGAPPLAGGGPLASAWSVWLAEPKDSKLNPAPGVVGRDWAQAGPAEATFVLSSTGVAHHVSLAVPGLKGAVFSDSNMAVLPWEPVALTLTAGEPFDAADVAGRLEVTTLADAFSSFDAAYFKKGAACDKAKTEL